MLGLHIRRLDGVLKPVVIEKMLLPVVDQVARMPIGDKPALGIGPLLGQARSKAFQTPDVKTKWKLPASADLPTGKGYALVQRRSPNPDEHNTFPDQERFKEALATLLTDPGIVSLEQDFQKPIEKMQ